MNPNAPRSGSRNVEADAYWRRRFFTLVAGLGLLGLLAWAFSGGGGTPHQTAGAAGGGGNVPAAYGTSVAGQPAGSAVTPTADPDQASIPLSSSPTATPTPSAAKTHKNTAASTSHQSQKPKTTAGHHACPARDIVLTLLLSKTNYGPGQEPKFQIEIVSTDAAECTLNVGRESLRVLITSESRADWDSGACLRGATARAETLRRGIPSMVSIVWDRKLRASGCSAGMVTAGNGRYVAMAVAGSVTSQAKGFRLS
jgi:hypothetical protein